MKQRRIPSANLAGAQPGGVPTTAGMCDHRTQLQVSSYKPRWVRQAAVRRLGGGQHAYIRSMSFAWRAARSRSLHAGPLQTVRSQLRFRAHPTITDRAQPDIFRRV